MKETIREFVDSRGLKIGIDRAGGLIRGVKILGTESRNGRTYLPEAICNAALLYEEAKVNVNHDQKQPSRPRDYRDRFGVIRNVSIRDGDGLFADFYFNPKHELAEQFLWDAEHAPENVGFSHNVIAQTSRENDQILVEKILKVQSVDLVADPATTSGLFEALEEPGEELQDGAKNVNDVAIAEMTESRDRLQEELAQLRAELVQQQRRHRIGQLIIEAGLLLPGSDNSELKLITDGTFIESLLEIDDERVVREQIYRQAELLKQAQQAVAPKNLQTRAQERAPFALPERTESSDSESFVRVITF